MMLELELDREPAGRCDPPHRLRGGRERQRL
jgi:hypothetical protein